MTTPQELFRAMESEQNTFAASDVMRRALPVMERWYAALTEIAKEQSGLTAQAVADRFQKVARDALSGTR